MDSKERGRLIEDIMKQLKLQADRKQELIIRKSIKINPQLLSKNNPSVYGPYYFETPFAKNPFIVFGQARLRNTAINGVLVVQPYIDRWILQSGKIDGFYLGVYALTPVPSNLPLHAINLMAVGRSSLYKGDRKYDSWRASYDNNTAGHLMADDGSMDKLQ